MERLVRGNTTSCPPDRRLGGQRPSRLALLVPGEPRGMMGGVNRRQVGPGTKRALPFRWERLAAFEQTMANLKGVPT